MTLATYTDLTAAAMRRLHRSDMAGDIPDLIALAEKRIAALLRTRLMDTAGSVSTVAGTVTTPLPSALLGIQSLSIAALGGSLDYMTPEQFANAYSFASYTGAPRAYTIIGDNLHFGPTPDAAYTVAIVYSGSVAPLTEAASTNALLTKWPNVYLYGVLAESREITRDDVNGARWEGKFLDAINSVNTIDWQSGGNMRVRTDVRS